MQVCRRLAHPSAVVRWAIVAPVLMILAAPAPATETTARPHAAPTSANLVANPNVDGSDQWRFSGDGGYDPLVSRSADGSGSLQLRSTYDEGAGYTILQSDLIKVSADQVYTFSVYMKAEVWPTNIALFIGNHDLFGGLIENNEGTRWGNSAAGIWEEAAIIYRPSSTDVHHATLKIVRRNAPEDGGRVWIDDIYFGRGIGLRQPPTPKRPFQGTSVRVDALGNFEIARDGAWTPFFPFCMFADQDRPLSLYSEQGWNCNIWAANAETVRRGAEAVSELNPDGMMSGLELAPYILEDGWAHGQLDQLEARLVEIRDQGWLDHLLMYYWDNETYAAWALPRAIIDDILPRVDGDEGGRRRPVYVLQGNYGLARVHAEAGLSDVVGTYAGGDAMGGGTAGDGRRGLFIMDRIHAQSSPAAFAQFNGLRSAGDLRRRLYNAITLGAKALGYWRDCYNPQCRQRWNDELLPADDYPWWPDVPHLRREVDALLPLIRTPHWTPWEIGVEPAGAVSWGTRDLDGVGHIILINQDEAAEALVTLDLGDLPYQVAGLEDYFDPGDRILAADGRAQVRLPPLGVGQGTRVLRLQPK